MLYVRSARPDCLEDFNKERIWPDSCFFIEKDGKMRSLFLTSGGNP
jgi:hypothetical protein